MVELNIVNAVTIALIAILAVMVLRMATKAAGLQSPV